MFVSLPLASWWTNVIPAFAVTSSKRSSGPAATGALDGERAAPGEDPCVPPGEGRHEIPESKIKTRTVVRRIVTFAAGGPRGNPDIGAKE